MVYQIIGISLIVLGLAFAWEHSSDGPFFALLGACLLLLLGGGLWVLGTL